MLRRHYQARLLHDSGNVMKSILIGRAMRFNKLSLLSTIFVTVGINGLLVEKLLVADLMNL